MEARLKVIDDYCRWLRCYLWTAIRGHDEPYELLVTNASENRQLSSQAQRRQGGSPSAQEEPSLPQSSTCWGLDYILSNSFGFGRVNSCVVYKRI